MRTRQKTQHELAVEDAGRGEAPRSSEGRVESTAAGLGTESQAKTDKRMEEVCEKENVKEALRRVKTNAGAAGMDGMTVKDLPDHLRQNWSRMKEQLLAGTPAQLSVEAVETRTHALQGTEEQGHRHAPRCQDGGERPRPMATEQ